ncbi:MAG: hypothetical protein JKY96_01840, partial [Phycisphaerales bacterium]|nr:hypothetical protein [Phycisphaerales bacterium]
MKSVSALLIPIALATLALASTPDPLAPRPNGMANARPTRHILLGGTVHISPTETYDSQTLSAIFIENGHITKVIEAVRGDLNTSGYQVHELGPDTHIYAGFIDAYVPIETSAPEPGTPGTHWNSFVTPQSDALDTGLPTETASDLRELGFTTAMIAPDHGVFR